MGSMGTASVAGEDADDERRNVSDAAGVAVLGACAAWSLITAAAHGGRPEGVLLAVLAVAGGYAAGRICASLLPVAAPCAGALAGLGLTVAVPHLAPGPQPGPPLGHAGATAALLALATGGASLFFGAPFLTSAYLAVTVPVLGELSFTTSVLLDIGIYLLVTGVAVDVLRLLGVYGAPEVAAPEGRELR